NSPCLPENSTCGALVGSNGTVCGASDVPASPAGSARLLLRTPYPNPATDSVSFELVESVGAEARIEVFAADGRKVRSLAVRAGTSSAGGASWDLQDSDGRRVPSGVYSVRVSVGSLEESARITVLD
ncbi:MAG: T9SS type A sorting domain-containing protein, partial [Candidatus Eisenbacteria bacterium]